MIKVLFVCLGNICRSPMAEAVFAHKLKSEGLSDKVFVDSAGTGDWHVGADPHIGTQRILDINGIEWNHRARVLRKSDYDDFDLIIAMDEDNLRTIKSRGKGTAEIRKLLEFGQSGLADVPDPYYDGNFAQTFELVDEASDGLMDWVKEKLRG